MLPIGFKVFGLHCGIAKKREKNDIAVFYSGYPCISAGMFTSNQIQAAPVLVSKEHLKNNANGIRAIIANSGNANACNGNNGIKDAKVMCKFAADIFRINQQDLLVASTGVIGNRLPVQLVKNGIKILTHSINNGKSDEVAAVKAIMTTDTFPKIVSKNIIMDNRKITIWGCAKGSGMIHPDLLPHATMLSFILTDANISDVLLKKALELAVESTFNCVSIDGDTSTNDSVFILANGIAKNKVINRNDKNYKKFCNVLQELCLGLAKMIARDGEGATRLVQIDVLNAQTNADAKKIASVIATSPLVKTAIFGNDANWGRIIAAVGRSGVKILPQKINICIDKLCVAKKGMATKFSEKTAKRLLQKKEVKITVNLNHGKAKATYYTCDFSCDYVKINASYRT